jgi:hypothetical protein
MENLETTFVLIYNILIINNLCYFSDKFVATEMKKGLMILTSLSLFLAHNMERHDIPNPFGTEGVVLKTNHLSTFHGSRENTKTILHITMQNDRFSKRIFCATQISSIRLFK